MTQSSHLFLNGHWLEMVPLPQVRKSLQLHLAWIPCDPPGPLLIHFEGNMNPKELSKATGQIVI